MFKSLSFLALAAVAGLGLGALFTPQMFTQSLAEDQGTAAFDKIATVLQHPRCVNCHPAGDAPLNGDEGRPHRMMIVRGPDNMGAPGARCTACHRDENSAMSIVPGAPEWSVAPKSMSWQGLTHAELCHALKDRAKNGDRDGPALIEHMSTPLVLWGWNPGGDRKPVPIPHDEFINLMKVWEAAGAPCPA
jgi:cytochrome c553